VFARNADFEDDELVFMCGVADGLLEYRVGEVLDSPEDFARQFGCED